MPAPAVAIGSGDAKTPIGSRELESSGESKNSSAKIRLVRWVSSHKQVFIAELLLRSTGRSD